MSSTSARSTLARQWELLQLLPGGTPGISASEIRQKLVNSGHQASKRTVERDLIELSRLFPLQCNSKGTPYGWYWKPGKSANLPGISISEALTLKLVENSIRPLIPRFMLEGLEARFAQARDKLDALAAENPTARWPTCVASVTPNMILLPPKTSAETLEAIQQALLSEKQIRASYQSSGKQQIRQMSLNPLALVQRGHTTYLLATSDGFSDVRQYALHRFQSAERLDSPCEVPSGFDLQHYIDQKLMQFGQQGVLILQAWVSERLADILAETPLSEDMVLTSFNDGEGFQLTATVTDTWELRWWLLSHTGAIVVHQPQALRDELRMRLEEGLGQYNQPHNTLRKS
ncbi:MAG: WYL domain-containing protein [Pseudomonas sp.]|nr:WYL domain-containing protein [Pseudomonas sp.]